MTEQEQSAQQPPEDEQPKRRRGRAVGAKASAGGRAQAGTSEAQTSDAGGSPQSKRQPANSGRNKKPQAQASDQETERTGSSESRSPVQDKGASAAQGQPAGNLDLGQLLQEQISLAIQPVLQDFRQQLATTVQHEVDQANDGPKRDGAAEARPESAPAQAALSSVTDQ